MRDLNELEKFRVKPAAGQQLPPGMTAYHVQTKRRAILRNAIATMRTLYKDVSARGRMVCEHRYTSIRSEPCLSCRTKFGEIGNWQWRGVLEQANGENDNW